MLLPRSVRAHLIERFIFNFRVKPEALASHLPVSYLRPQVFHGWSVVSFCMLKLDEVMLSPLPSWPGFQTISCAYRCGVIDNSAEKPMPSVYVPGRYTDLPIISYFAPWIFSSPIHEAYASFTQKGPIRTLRANCLDGYCLFAAQIKPSPHPGKLASQLFDSIDSFARFMQSGISSYTPAIQKGTLARIDLQKDDTQYEPLDAIIEFSSLDTIWNDTELIFDSSMRTSGGQYKWTCVSLIDGRPCYVG